MALFAGSINLNRSVISLAYRVQIIGDESTIAHPRHRRRYDQYHGANTHNYNPNASVSIRIDQRPNRLREQCRNAPIYTLFCEIIRDWSRNGTESMLIQVETKSIQNALAYALTPKRLGHPTVQLHAVVRRVIDWRHNQAHQNAFQ